jgi:uncharacterized protein
MQSTKFAPTPLRILITGATGFIGQSLVPLLLAQGHQVIVWSRSSQKAKAQFGFSVEAVADLQEIDDQLVDLVINLAGARILGMPWAESRRKVLYSSRIDLTKKLVEWMQSRTQKPSLFLSASAIGYYGIQAQSDKTEWTEEQPPQSIFMSQLCQEWETVAKAISSQVPVVAMRLGVVLGHGGALPMMLLPIKSGLGGRLGTGKQVMSWIHLQDLLKAMAHISHKHFSGENRHENFSAINFTSPQAVTQTEFSKTAAGLLNRPWWLATPAFSLKLLGEQSDLLLEGQRVVPFELLKSGFEFSFPDIESALKDILQK